MRARILNASAGSGKTYQLAYKYVRDVVEQPTLYRHILAVTFTNKATEEMKSRILSEIHTLASGGKSGYLASLCTELSLDERRPHPSSEARTRILHDYSRFTILTIDTFFQRILRAFIQELGLDLNYNVEIETASVLSKSADALVEQIRIDEELQRWLTAFVQERIEDGKRWDVREGILALGNENIQGEQPRNPLGGAFQGRTGPDRRQGDGEGQGREKGVSGIGRSGHEPHEYRWRHDGRLHRQEPQLRGLLRGRSRRRDQSTHSYRAQDERDDGRLVRQGLAGLPLVAELQPLLAELCARYDRSIRFWNTTDLLRENYRSFALLQDLYGKVRQMCSDENVMMLSETKKHPLGVHPPQRRPVHLRKSRQPLRPVHDRRISGHLDPGVGKLPAPAGQRHGTVGTDLGADRGRHQTVDLPLAGRRLGDPAPPGGTGSWEKRAPKRYT